MINKIFNKFKVGSLKDTNKIDKAMAGLIEEKRELTNKSISRHTCNLINSFILQMVLSPVILLSFRNTTKIKAHKSLALMGLWV